MGYYSNVKFITTNRGWEKMKQAVEKASPDYAQYVIGASHTTSLGNDRYILLELEGIKWYDTWDEQFPEVCAFVRTLDVLDEAGIPYRFMRVGEDDMDVEQRQNEPDYKSEWADMPDLALSRTIEVEY